MTPSFLLHWWCGLPHGHQSKISGKPQQLGNEKVIKVFNANYFWAVFVTYHQNIMICEYNSWPMILTWILDKGLKTCQLLGHASDVYGTLCKQTHVNPVWRRMLQVHTIDWGINPWILINRKQSKWRNLSEANGTDTLTQNEYIFKFWSVCNHTKIIVWVYILCWEFYTPL